MLRNSLKRNNCDMVSSRDFKTICTNGTNEIVKLKPASPLLNGKIQEDIHGLHSLNMGKKMAIISLSPEKSISLSSRKQIVTIPNSNQLKKQKSCTVTTSKILQLASERKRIVPPRKLRKPNFQEHLFTQKSNYPSTGGTAQKKMTYSLTRLNKNQNMDSDRRNCQMSQIKNVSKCSSQSLNKTIPTNKVTKLIKELEKHIDDSLLKKSCATGSSKTEDSEILKIREKNISSHNRNQPHSKIPVQLSKSNVRSPSPYHSVSSSSKIKAHPCLPAILSTGPHSKSNELYERKLRFSSFDKLQLMNKNSKAIIHDRLIKSQSELKHPKHQDHKIASCKSNISFTSASKSSNNSNSKSAKQNVDRGLHSRTSLDTYKQNKEQFHTLLKHSASTSSILPIKSAKHVSCTQSESITSALESPTLLAGSSQTIIASGSSDVLMSDVDMPNAPEILPSLDDFPEKMDVDDFVPDNPDSYAFVVDTNIFIHHLNFINELKDVPLEGFGPPCIYISWIVIRELDGLKDGDLDVTTEVNEAIRFIFHILDSKHPRVCGQGADMVKKLPRTYGDTNDDLLLSYCTFLAEKLSSNNVCLLTDDKNLCNKAMISNIKSFTTENFYSRLKPDISFLRKNNETCENLNSPGEAKKKIDFFICEAKYYTKTILEQFMYESTKAELPDKSDSLLTPRPTSLCEILEYYKKYWVLVFETVFDKGLKKHFETLTVLFIHKRDYFYQVDDALSALNAVEVIFKGIQKHKPSVRPQVQIIGELKKKCQILRNSKEGNYQEDSIRIVSTDSEIAYEVFNHIWKIMHSLCGMLMDFAKIPHNLNYDQPSSLPEASEFQCLLCNLFPAMNRIQFCMSKIVEIISMEEQAKCEQNYKELYDALLQFVPSLKIHILPPPIEKFTFSCLKSFSIDSNYRNQITSGFRQLQKYLDMLVQCAQHPIFQN